MSISNGQDANATNFNNAFMSRTANTSTTGTVELANSGSATISDLQSVVNGALTDITTLEGDVVSLDGRLDSLEANESVSTHAADTTSVHGIADTSLLVTTTGAQVLTAKDIDGGTASNTSRLTIPKATKTTLDGLTRKEATIVYATDTAKAYIDTGSSLVAVGSGSGGGINYITDGDAESNTAIGTSYNDSAASDKTRPDDATGGVVSTSTDLNFTVTTSTPIRGTRSYLFSKKSGDKQGFGRAIPFTHPGLVERCQVEIEYNVVSGTYATGDVRIYLRDQTTGTVIEPVNTQIAGVGVVTKHIASFQTTLNSTSYLLCFHIASATTSAFDLEIDSIAVGPQVTTQGAFIEDWRSWTPTGSWVSNCTYTGMRRRIGDEEEFRVLVTASGAVTAAALTITLPVTIDTTKLLSTGALSQPLGEAVLYDATGSGYLANTIGKVLYSSTTAVGVRVMDDASASAHGVGTLDNATPVTIASGDTVALHFKVPVVGYGSNVTIASADSGRVVAAKMYRNAALTTLNPNNSYVKIALDATEFDTHGGANLASNRYDIKEAGYYDIIGSVSINSTNMTTSAYFCGIYKNGSLIKIGSSNYQSTATQSIRTVASTKVLCAVGDYIELYFFAQANHSASNLTVNNAATGTTLEISKISSGSQAITAGEFVGCRYSTNAGQSISGAGAVNTILFEDKEFDSHNAYNTSTGIFTAPVAGKYQVKTRVTSTNGGGWAAGEYWLVGIDNSAHTDSRTIEYTKAAHTYRVEGFCYDIVELPAGGTISVYVQQNSGGALALDAASTDNFLAISKVG